MHLTLEHASLRQLIKYRQMGVVRLSIRGACLLILVDVSIWCQGATILQAVDIVAGGIQALPYT